MKIIMAAIKNVAKLAGISPSTTSRALYDMISQDNKGARTSGNERT